MISAPEGTTAKRRGAYYTDEAVARFMVRWALRQPDETVMDPSFGGGVFLVAALERLEHLGGKPEQLSGFEIDRETHQQVSALLGARYGLPSGQLHRADFYSVSPKTTAAVDVIVGNPPYIRYQRFKGKVREKALNRARQQGVVLSGLASSWASFLVHSCALLKRGGRLAMVIPTEIGHAPFARPVLEYLINTFARVQLITFRERLFPSLGQDALVLLAADKGTAGRLELIDLASSRDLRPNGRLEPTVSLDAARIIKGQVALNHAFISKEAQLLYDELKQRSVQLGDIATVSTGYVTGANRFFHLSQERVQALGLPVSQRKKTVFRSGVLSGLNFTNRDFRAASSEGKAGYLLSLSARSKHSAALNAYLQAAEADRVHLSYKCRARSPWYAVPGIRVPAAFLNYMSGLYPRLIANGVGATAPNTLHHVYMNTHSLKATTLSFLWQSSLTALSAELEGHALGGGMLKLEPGEAKKTRLAWPADKTIATSLLNRVDEYLRQNEQAKASHLVDQAILENRLGLATGAIECLREAAETLRFRRYYKTTSSSSNDH